MFSRKTVVILLFTVTTCFTQQSDWRVTHFFSQAKTAYENQSYVRAQSLLEKTLWLDPTHIEAYNYLGFLYTHNGNLSQAITFFNKALLLDPTYLDALFGKANCYINLKKYGAAIPILESILEIRPSLGSMYTSLGWCLLMEKRFKEAEEVILFGENLQTSFVNNCNLGHVYTLLGEDHKAIAYYDAAMKNIKSQEYFNALVQNFELFIAKKWQADTFKKLLVMLQRSFPEYIEKQETKP